MDLVVDVYGKTKTFPKEETYAITQQIRKCVVSIPSNISEGAGRNTDSQLKHFLEISMGSCNELQTQIELSRRLGYHQDEVANKILDETLQIYRMILTYYNGLWKGRDDVPKKVRIFQFIFGESRLSLLSLYSG